MRLRPASRTNSSSDSVHRRRNAAEFEFQQLNSGVELQLSLRQQQAFALHAYIVAVRALYQPANLLRLWTAAHQSQSVLGARQLCGKIDVARAVTRRVDIGDIVRDCSIPRRSQIENPGKPVDVRAVDHAHSCYCAFATANINIASEIP